MRRSKRLCSLLLAMALLLTGTPFAPLAPLTAEAAAMEGYYTYTVSNGEAIIMDVNTSISGNVTIPSALGGYPVTTISGQAFYYCTRLTSVTIPESVTAIGYEAFYNCTGLTSVTIGNSVETIGFSAFENCTSLISLTVSDSVKTIGDYAFKGCTALTSITIPDSVASVGFSVFSGTAWFNSLQDGIIYVGKIAYTYKGTCPSQVTIKEGTLDIASYAFNGCTDLTGVTIPDSVKTIGDYAFKGCTALTSITIPDSVASVGCYAFENTGWYNNKPAGLVYAGKVAYKYKGTCPSQVSIIEGTLGIAGGAFDGCTGLTSVTIPDTVTTIGPYAFSGCTSLSRVNISDLAAWCAIDFGDGYANPLYYAKKLYLDGTLVTNREIPDSVKTIGDYAFYNCTGLKSVTIGNSVETIGDCAFYNCTGLKSVTIGNSVETIGDNAFCNCTGLTSVTIGNSVTTIGNDAFSGCSGLTSVTIPDSVTTIGGSAFSFCTDLTSVTIPDSVETIGRLAFHDCDGLTSMTIPDSVTFIGDGAFYNCTGLKSVTIGNSVETIRDKAFCDCTGLTSVTIGNSVEAIGDYAFCDCDGLTSLTIPDSVTTIGDYAFYNCTGLNGIYFDGSAPEMGFYLFYEVTATAYYYPDETWTDSVMQNYGGTITWVARECSHNYSSVVTPPTCTEQGYTTHTCSKCGNSYKDTYTSSNGHTWGDWEKLDDTYHKHTCIVCKIATETKTHDWDAGTITKQPTCKEAGTKTYACPTCSGKKTEILPVTNDHVYGDWEKVDETYHKRTCTVCKTHSETAEHVPGEWIVDREATCKQVGSQHQECADCGATLQTAEIPLADHRYESEVTKVATCTEDGIITNTCTVCGHSYTVVVRAEHNYQPTDRKEATCTEDGYITYTCSKCGDHYDETITAGHKYVATITKVATATQDGEITYTCSVCGHSYTEVIPARPNARVLLIQDTNPWQENNNIKLLNQMVSDGYLEGWDMSTTQFDADDLAGYSVILIANDQYSNTYSNLQQRQNLLVQFAQAGGTVIYGACDKGWANGDITYTLPGGVTSSNYYSRYNYIVNGGHPVVTGAATDGKALTNSLLYGNYCSHTAFGNLPEDAVVILQDGNGDPTLVEYAMGEGHIILSGLTWEFYYTRAAYGGGDTTYTRNVYDDLVLYALQRGDSCVHVYEETKTVEPTCETNGYIVYTCKECGAVKTVTNADKLGHTYGDWEQVDETYHKHTCTVCKTHSETEKHNFGEDHVCTDCGYKAYTVGDFDGDGLVTDADVIWLLWYTVFPEDYPLNQSGDFDGDGLVTDADVIYLLWHTVFPEDYPIN